jgi:hypothetical protein
MSISLVRHSWDWLGFKSLDKMRRRVRHPPAGHILPVGYATIKGMFAFVNVKKVFCLFEQPSLVSAVHVEFLQSYPLHGYAYSALATVWPSLTFFACWAVVYFGQFFLLQRKRQFFESVFPQNKRCINFDETWVGLHFGRFFANSSGYYDSGLAWRSGT